MIKFILRKIKNRLAAGKAQKAQKAQKAGMIFPAEFAGYDAHAALNLAIISEWAYPHGKSTATDYKNDEAFLVDMEHKRKKAASWGYSEFNYVYSGDLKILALILRDGPDMIIAFRGTVIDSTVNWQIDLQAGLIPMDSFGGVHKGFSAALDSIWAGVKNHISPRETRRIWLTGHSLGGALALMAGARLITDYRKHPNIIINGIYVFAAPRVGDRDFADSFRNTYLERRSFIFVNHNDIITVLPPCIQKISEYMNVGNILYIDPGGVIGPVASLSEFKIISQFLTGHFKEQFIAGFTKEKIVHDWQSFVQFFTGVFSGVTQALSASLKTPEQWARFEDFFSKVLPAPGTGSGDGADVAAQREAQGALYNRDLEKGYITGADCDGEQWEQQGQGRLFKMIRELFVELFMELNPYVIESHDIATYIKSLQGIS